MKNLLKNIYIYILITLIALTPFSHVVKADDESGQEEGNDTPPVTIIYAEGVEIDSNDPTSWDGETTINITKSATIIFNSGITITGQLKIGDKAPSTDFSVEIKGNNYKITQESKYEDEDDEDGDLTPIIFSYNDNLKIDSLKVEAINRPVIGMGGNVELTNCDFSTTETTTLLFANSNKNLIINSGEYKTYNSNKLIGGSSNTSNLNTTIKNGEFVLSSTLSNNSSTSTITIENGTFSSPSTIISNDSTSTITINGGNFSITETKTGNAMFVGGTINITGGSFDGKDKNEIFVAGKNVSVGGCTISNFDTAFFISSNYPGNTILKNITFSNIDSVFQLYGDQTIDFENGFSSEVNIFAEFKNIKYGDKHQITTITTDKDLISYIKSYNNTWSIDYDSTNQYYYMYKDPNKLSYYVNVYNQLIATDGLNNDSVHEFFGFGISASDMTYSGKAYDGKNVTYGGNMENISTDTEFFTLIGDKYTITYESVDGTTYPSSTTPPTEVGEYKVTLSLKGQSISDTFKITKKNTYKVSYKFISDDGNSLPEEITNLLPSETTVEEDTIYTPTNPSNTSVEVSDGTWNFKGYDVENKKIDSDYTFTGTWSFTKKEEPKPEENKPSTPTLTKAGTYTSSINIEAKSGDESLTVILNVTIDGKTTTYKGKGSVTVSLSGSDNESKTYTIESYVLSSDGSIQSDVVKETYIIDKTNNKTDNNTNTNTNTNTNSSQGNVPCEVSGRVWSMKQQKCVYKVSNTRVK